MRSFIFSLLLALPVFAVAIEDAPPPMPSENAPVTANSSTNAPKAETEKPDIRVIKKGDATLTEYRMRGHLYQIRVEPKVGEPYFLVDTLGQGNFIRQNGPTENISVPRWVLFSW